MEDIARRKVAQEYHTKTVSNMEQQLSAAKRAASSHEAQAKAEIARLNGLVKEKDDQLAALEASAKQVRSVAGYFWPSICILDSAAP